MSCVVAVPKDLSTAVVAPVLGSEKKSKALEIFRSSTLDIPQVRDILSLDLLHQRCLNKVEQRLSKK
jgi:hypothetical protein